MACKIQNHDYVSDIFFTLSIGTVSNSKNVASLKKCHIMFLNLQAKYDRPSIAQFLQIWPDIDVRTKDVAQLFTQKCHENE